MLSYRHAFHAGNIGDVLKHVLLARIMSYMVIKDQALLYLDTHAGAGYYDLSLSMYRKSADGLCAYHSEAATGILRLWKKIDTAPAMLQPYLQVLRSYNPNGVLHHYPGSPSIANYFLRPQDRAVCYELHPTDYPILQARSRQFHRRGRGVSPHLHMSVWQQDGLAGLRANLPPKERRGVILIDPSYELDREYRAVAVALQEAYQRFAGGVYILWYPLLSSNIAAKLLHSLNKLAITKTLRIELVTSPPDVVGRGLLGSGLWLINPPWVLEEELRTTIPWLAEQLNSDIITYT